MTIAKQEAGVARKVLVTGGAGYIGSHTCKALARAGFVPVTYDNLSRGHEWAVKWGPLEKGDIADKERLKSVIARHRPVAVLHFAAYAYVGESMGAPGLYYRNNVVGTLGLVEALQETGVDKLVFSSSCAVYGIPAHLPISEEQTKTPINPYGAGKLMVERMLKDFTEAHGLRLITLRFFNAAGADPDCEIGEVHEPETHLIPLVLNVASGLTSQVVVRGDDYSTPDGSCIRDYVHVADLADAHVLALLRLLAGGASATYNLGAGTGYSVREVIRVAQRVTECTIPAFFGPRRTGDPPILIADPNKAIEELGWAAKRSSLDRQITDAWRWHQTWFANRQTSAVGW